MDPTSFQFTVTMPGDTRLVGAVRELTTHAATYAQLPPEVAASMAADVVAAAESAIASIQADGPIEFLFNADADGVCITISEGSRQICRIRQQVSG